MEPANLLAFYRTVADRSPLPLLSYNFPQATGYDMPAELVIELAVHPILIGIKESSGDVEKVRKMVDGTRQIKRSAAVTETFDAVTPRMLEPRMENNGQGGERVPVPAWEGAAKPSSPSGVVVFGQRQRKKAVAYHVRRAAAE